MLAAIFLTLLVKLQTRSWFITESSWWYYKLQFFSKQQPEHESLAPSRDIKTQCSILRFPILCNVCCGHFHFISIFYFTWNPAMNAVPDLRLILFKELQAILHVATAMVMPGLNHFEAYWTVFPCETIHRATNRCSLCCEILLCPSPGGSARDKLESPARGCKQGRDTQLPSPPLSANLCACSNKNPFFLNLNSNCSEGGLPEQSEVKVNHTRASLSRKEAAWVVWDIYLWRKRREMAMYVPARLHCSQLGVLKCYKLR